MKMKRIFSILSFASLMFFVFSGCSKHEIKYMTDDVKDDVAEVKIFNYINSTSTASVLFKNGTLNNSSVVTSSYTLAQWGSRPSSSGMYYTLEVGSATLNLFKTADGTTPDLTATFNLTSGKTDVYLVSYNLPPVLVSSGYPLGYGTNTNAVSTYVRFLNLLMESADVPYSGKLQYQWALIPKTLPRTAASVTEWNNVGSPVAYGEATDWTAIDISNFMDYWGNPGTTISSGYCHVEFRILTEDGSVLKVMGSTGAYADYFDYWSCSAGRHATHVEKGIRTVKTTGLRSGVALNYAQ